MNDKRFIVFEAINETLREIFVGKTDLDMRHVITRFRSVPPAGMAHWTPIQEVRYRGVRSNVAASFADECVAEHAKSVEKPGWKVLT